MQNVKPRRRGALLTAAGVVATLVAAAGTVTVASAPASAREPGTTLAKAAPRAERGLTAEQRRRADQLISTFENSSTQLRYDAAENLLDGRGITAGRAGFTTATAEALTVVRRYTQRKPGNPLARFLPELQRLAVAGSDATKGLPEDDFVTAWVSAAQDHAFRAVQDDVVDDLYFLPAMKHADAAGLRSALARAQVYDAAVQHGIGAGPQGIGALLARARSRAGGVPGTGVDEKKWLQRFFEARIAALGNPAATPAPAGWAASVDRVMAMQRIAATGNYELAGPIRVDVYGDTFTVD